MIMDSETATNVFQETFDQLQIEVQLLLRLPSRTKEEWARVERLLGAMQAMKFACYPDRETLEIH